MFKIYNLTNELLLCQFIKAIGNSIAVRCFQRHHILSQASLTEQ